MDDREHLQSMLPLNKREIKQGKQIMRLIKSRDIRMCFFGKT